MSNPYSHLLEPVQVGKFILKNRMQSSNSLPHFSQGPEKYPADPTIAHFVTRAKSGAAWITLAGMDDNVDNPPLPESLDVSHFPDFDIHEPLCQNYLVEMIEAIHYEGSLVSGSLFSANKKYRYENADGTVEIVNITPPAKDEGPGASALANPYITDEVPAELFAKVIASYAQQTALYRRLGFDAVTIHMSYRAQLPAQLLSPLTNQRTDEYGPQTLENRERFALELLAAVRKAAGRDMLIEIQFSSEDEPGGYTFEEGIHFLKNAQQYIDIVQVRSPEVDENHPIPFELEKMPFLDMAARVKAQGLDFLVSNVGGYFDPAAADQAIAEGKVDLVAMARAWISNPEYGRMLYEDRADDIVPCLRCNKCHGRGPHDIFTTVCSVNPKFGFEAVDRYLGYPVAEKKNVAIIGGGPGGMRTALFLADRGHTVTIYEAEDALGGAIKHSDYVNFKWTLKDYKDYLIRKVNENPAIKIILNTKAAPEMVENRYDAVIAAIGAAPVILPIPGADGDNVMVATEAIMDIDRVGQNVVVIGGGEVGVETGMFLAQNGRDVTVIEMRDMIAADTTSIHYRSMFQAAWEKLSDRLHFVLEAGAKSITLNGVEYTDRDGIVHVVPADTVVMSAGMRAKKDEALSFYGHGGHFYMVGDCIRPGTIQTTNRSAYVTAGKI